MGRESRARKNRRCRICRKHFAGMDASQILQHYQDCDFESRTGIQVIRAEEREAPPHDEPLVILA